MIFLAILKAFAIFFCKNLRNLQCLKFQKQSREDSSLYAKKSYHVSLELETLVLEEKVKRMFREECMKIGMEEGVKRRIEQWIEQARKIFHLYLSGRSEEDIAKETGEDIELIRKVLNG